MFVESLHVKNKFDPCSRLEKMQACDRQTDRQTDRHTHMYTGPLLITTLVVKPWQRQNVLEVRRIKSYTATISVTHNWVYKTYRCDIFGSRCFWSIRRKCTRVQMYWLAWREMIRPQAAWRPQQHGGQCAVKWYRNLKPKLAIMRQCTSVTDRRTDRRTLAS